jgi:hypothetical protein
MSYPRKTSEKIISTLKVVAEAFLQENGLVIFR